MHKCVEQTYELTIKNEKENLLFTYESDTPFQSFNVGDEISIYDGISSRKIISISHNLRCHERNDKTGDNAILISSIYLELSDL